MSRFAWIVALFAAVAPVDRAQAETVVGKHGQLRVQGNRIVDKNGAAVQLRGMSLYWSQWIPKYYNAATIQWLRDDWKITVIRAAMAVKPDGYEKNPAAERDKVIAVVDAAIKLGLYVVIDYHAHTAHENRAQAQAFFADMARRYGNTPNVLYETYNEPLNVSWADVLKPYHEAVIDSIREHDPDNIVIVGTRNWSQQVAEAAANPVRRSNVAYTLHFYANTHGQWLRDQAQAAMNAGAALFVTEYGTTDATGKYQFPLKPETDYRLKVDKEGFFKQSARISTKGKPSAIIYTDFRLFPLVVDQVVRLENIFYDYNKWDIRPDAAVELDKLVLTLQDNPTVSIELSSHTDCRGKDAYNMSLSQKRAKSAVDYLISKGIAATRVTSKGYGESKPSETCACEQCSEEQHQRNRRTEFKVLSK